MPQEADAPAALNLRQVALQLGVHYMTVYRYVRLGALAARREGNVWMVDPDALARFEAEDPRVRRAATTTAASSEAGAGAGTGAAPGVEAGAAVGAGAGADWAGRFRRQLLAGDEVGAWTVMSQALTAGWDPQRCYLELIGGGVASIGADVAVGDLAVADQYLATATAQRVAAQLGTRFRRRGRSKGTVVVGAPSGERHALPIAIVADLLRLEGFTVLELGADVPPAAFAVAAQRSENLVAVGIGLTTVAHFDAAVEVVAAVRAARPDVPVLAGGQAVRSPEVAAALGVDEWAPDGAGVVTIARRLTRSRSRRPRPR